MTKSILEESGLTVDESGFEKEMEKQRELARSSTQMTGSIFDEGPIATIKETVKETAFLGYENCETESRVIGIIINEQLVKAAKAGQEIHIVLDQTPFYAEAGGQVGDIGIVQTKNSKVEISNTKKSNDIIVHIGRVVEGKIKTNETVTSIIDKGRRAAIKRNHSATHLLHYTYDR